MATWLELETRFLELETKLRTASLDYQGGASGANSSPPGPGH